MPPNVHRPQFGDHGDESRDRITTNHSPRGDGSGPKEGLRGSRSGANTRGTLNHLRAEDTDRMTVDRRYNPRANYQCRATQRTPLLSLLENDPDEPVATDVEFQHHKWVGTNAVMRIGRIAVVNTKGQVIYDTCAKYDYDKDRQIYFAKGFPIGWKDIDIRNGAQRIHTVNEDLRAIFKNRRIIVHAKGNDRIAITPEILSVGQLIDTQDLYSSSSSKQPSLQSLIHEHLDASDFVPHDPRDDARAAMQLYLRLRPYPPLPNYGNTTYAATAQQNGRVSATNMPLTNQGTNIPGSNGVASEEKMAASEGIEQQATDSGCEIASDDGEIATADNQEGDLWGY